MASHIYHGPWINWSHGGIITGATVTLSQRSGGLLTSFIATFVTLVGVQLWKILSFAIHQLRSTTRPRDGLFHQQQVVWRNTPGPGAVAWIFAQQMWYWRRSADRSFLRTFFWILFAAVYLVLFALLAIFSSEISKSPGSQRLLVGDACGYWIATETLANTSYVLSQKQTNDSHIADTYARACYGGSSNPLQCGRFVVPSISWEADANATCPFASGMCYYGDTAAYQITSKLIDSRDDLGINTPDNERLQYQKRTTCAPIHMKGYANYTHDVPGYNGESTHFNDSVLLLWYGASLSNASTPGLPGDTPFTWLYDIKASAAGIGYTLNTEAASANDTSIGWQPIPELVRDDADVTLLFLAQNSMRYTTPIDDPWFAATDPINAQVGIFNTTWYNSDQYVTTMACAEQYRHYIPNNNRYTPWLGGNQLRQSVLDPNSELYAPKLGMNVMQLGLAIHYGWTVIPAALDVFTNPGGGTALRAQDTVYQLEQYSLPSNQWQIEVGAWFDAGLAAIQQYMINYAAAPTDLPAGAALSQPAVEYNDLASKIMCENQMINDSSGTMSFSVLGMTILFAIGGLIILTSLIIDRAVGLVQRCLKRNPHARRAWLLDDKLQLQKNVFEHAGMGRWKEGDDASVPTTLNRDKFSRFGDDQIYCPNTPDSPSEQPSNEVVATTTDGFTHQKTEYAGAHGLHGRVEEIRPVGNMRWH